MCTKIRIPKYLRDKTDGKAEAHVNGRTVRECIEALIQQHPSLKGEILDDQGMVILKWVIYINDSVAIPSDALSRPVGNSDTIMLIPLIAGG
jgi:molybdopterin converting factor small subunit